MAETGNILVQQSEKTLGAVGHYWDKLDSAVLLSTAIDYGTRLIGVVLIFLIGRLVAGWVQRFFRRVMARNLMDPTMVGFLANIVYGIIMLLVGVTCISTLGVATTSLAAVIAAAGLAVGLALQGSLSNFAAGVLIVAFRPFGKGDSIEAAGTAGTVQDISIIYTTLLTADHVKVTVPNSKITDGPIRNLSAVDARRLEIPLTVASGDFARLEAVVQGVLKAEPRLKDSPAPTVAVSGLTAAGLSLLVQGWANPADLTALRSDLLAALNRALRENGMPPA